MHPFVGEARPKFGAEDFIGAVEDEVDDFVGCVDDPEPVRSVPERTGEEFLVQTFDGGLFAGGILDAGHAAAHRFVERFEVLDFSIEPAALQRVDHALHHLGDRVLCGE